MPIPRSRQVFPDITPYYHCVSRCVRRAWLCGMDSESGQNFDHRKDWIEKRLLRLSAVFAIDLAAYAVMSNHYHVVLCLKSSSSSAWSDHEVIKRWGQLCHLPSEASKFSAGATLDNAQMLWLRERIETWRSRLSSLSWFMRYVNEPLARRANREDDCTGRFWEGRFKCQALLDETALLACMAYVDLNPVRAGIVRQPQLSMHTSFRRRITQKNSGLQGFADSHQFGAADSVGRVLPIREKAYFELIDWSSRIVVREKSEPDSERPPAIFPGLGGHHDWIQTMYQHQRGGIFFGARDRLKEICSAVGRSWIWGSGSMLNPQTV